jgi:hypothetical protein
MGITGDELVARLTRAGELELSGENEAETNSYFDTGQSAAHHRVPWLSDLDRQGDEVKREHLADHFTERISCERPG